MRPRHPDGAVRPLTDDAGDGGVECKVTITDDFVSALGYLQAADSSAELLPVRLARASTRVLPIAGAGISVFTDPSFRIPVGASDDIAAVAERLQFTIGEGPCIQAHVTAQTVLAPETFIAQTWPGFYDQLVARTPFRAVTSVPLRGLLSGIGALDFFHHDSADIARLNLADIEAVAHQISTALITADLLPDPNFGPVWSNSPVSEPRSWVLIAMGMISVSIDVQTDDALALMRAHAFAGSLTVDDVARDVVMRRLTASQLRVS